MTTFLAALPVLAALAASGCGEPSVARATPTTRSTPPDFSQVAKPLCQRFRLRRADCAASSFAAPIVFELDADPAPEWIYVNTRGGDELCYVRNACFAILDDRGAAWQVVLSAMGTEVGLAGDDQGKVERDLVVAGSDSAEEATVTLWSWRDGRYRAVRTTTCVRTESNPSDELCRALEASRPIL